MGFISHLVILSLLVVNTLGFFEIVPLCDKRRGLSEDQVNLCLKKNDHMKYAIDASKISMFQCKKQFSGHRWNCTFPKFPGIPPLLHPKMPIASKESAFIHASTSAAIMHTVSRACMEGKLDTHCACSKEKRPDSLPVEHLWRGCGDNLPYGYKFSRDFIDKGQQLVEDTMSDFSRVLMNLHNNEAGRWSVFEKSRIQCRCHGVSKNCATKMCYRQLAEFKVVSKHLSQLYERSIQVKIQRDGEDSKKTELKLTEVDPNFNKFSVKDLVYIKQSPSFCVKDIEKGSYYNIMNRECTNRGDKHRDCSNLCCGRGYISKKQTVEEKCGCKFVWCCQVKCKTCVREKNMHYCK